MNITILSSYALSLIFIFKRAQLVLLLKWNKLIAGVTLVKPEDIDFPSTMTDIQFDTWMLRYTDRGILLQQI